MSPNNSTIPNAAISFGKSGGDILSTKYPDPVWVIPDFVPAGMTIFAGRPKIGKSWLTMQMTQAISAGGMLFGKPVQSGRVLYLALEDNERRLQERMNKQGWIKKSADNTTFFTMSDFRTYIGALHKAGWRHLEEIVKNGGYRLVVIDTLSRAFMGLKDMNDSQEITAALSPLQELAMKNEFSILIVDHHAKPKGNNPNPIDDIMGSTAKSAVLDTAMGIYKDTQTSALRLLAEGREVPPIDITLKFDVVTGCWQSEGDTDRYVSKASEREIIDVLVDMGTATLSDISKAIGKDKGNTAKRLKKLEDMGIVEKLKDNAGVTIAYKYIGSV